MGRRNGKGTEYYIKHDIEQGDIGYVGMFIDNKRHGRGKRYGINETGETYY